MVSASLSENFASVGSRILVWIQTCPGVEEDNVRDVCRALRALFFLNVNIHFRSPRADGK